MFLSSLALALAPDLPGPQTAVLEQRRWGSGLALGAAFSTDDDLDLQAESRPVEGRIRRQLGRRFALDPAVSFRLPRKGNWRAIGELGLRYYALSIGPVHATLQVGARLGGGATATPAPLASSRRFLDFDLLGGGGVEWTISPRFSAGVQGRTAAVSSGRRWNQGIASARPSSRRVVETQVEVHRWF